MQENTLKNAQQFWKMVGCSILICLQFVYICLQFIRIPTGEFISFFFFFFFNW